MLQVVFLFLWELQLVGTSLRCNLQLATEHYKKMADSLPFPCVPGGYGPTAPVRLPRRIHHLYSHIRDAEA